MKLSKQVTKKLKQYTINNIKKHIFLFVFTFFSLSIYSQNNYRLKGVVKDSITDDSLGFALVQVISNDDKQTIIDYKSTDENGVFLFNNLTIKSCILRVRFLGYKNYDKPIDLSKNTKITILLQPSSEKLNNVVLHIKATDFVSKNDTITYNLKKIIDSTETNLADIVKKLPGLTIDDDKKIHYKGKKIYKVTIDGNDFFGQKHEMATDNLPANAIKSITLLKKYKDFDNINQKYGQSKVVLNINLKDSYKGKFTGNIETKGGYLDKFYIHNNLFHFFKNGNIAFVSEYNNTGESAIGILDYIEMKGGIMAFIQEDDLINGVNTFEIDDSKIPSYVMMKDNVQKRNVLFNSLNFAKNIRNTNKVIGYIIFNKSLQNTLNTSNQKFFFQNSILNKDEYSNGNSNNNLINSFFEIIHKKNRQSSFKYQLKINYSNSKDSILTENSDLKLFKQNFKTGNFNIGQNINYKKNISSNNYFESSLSIDFMNDTINKSYLSNESFLNASLNTDNYSIILNNRTKKYDISQHNSFYHLINNKSDLTINMSLFYNDIKDRIFSFYNNYNSDIHRNEQKISNQLIYKIDLNTSLKLTAKTNFNFQQIKVNNISKKYYNFNPKLSLNYLIKYNTHLNFTYLKTTSFFYNKYLFENKRIEGQYSIIQNNPMDYFFIPKISNKFQIVFSGEQSSKNRMFNINMSYSKNQNDISFNISDNNNFITKRIIRKPSENINANLFFSTPFFKLPITTDLDFSYNLTNIDEVFHNTVNNKTINNFNIYFSNLTKFQRKFFQLNYGINFDYTFLSNSIKILDYKVIKAKPFVKIVGKIHKVKYNFSYQYTYIKNSSLVFKTNNLGFETTYNYNKFSFQLKLYNLLNLKNNFSTSQSYFDGYSKTVTFHKLPGYIILGIKYDY